MGAAHRHPALVDRAVGRARSRRRRRPPDRGRHRAPRLGPRRADRACSTTPGRSRRAAGRRRRRADRRPAAGPRDAPGAAGRAGRSGCSPRAPRRSASTPATSSWSRRPTDDGRVRLRDQRRRREAAVADPPRPSSGRCASWSPTSSTWRSRAPSAEPRGTPEPDDHPADVDRAPAHDALDGAARRRPRSATATSCSSSTRAGRSSPAASATTCSSPPTRSPPTRCGSSPTDPPTVEAGDGSRFVFTDPFPTHVDGGVARGAAVTGLRLRSARRRDASVVGERSTVAGDAVRASAGALRAAVERGRRAAGERCEMCAVAIAPGTATSSTPSSAPSSACARLLPAVLRRRRRPTAATARCRRATSPSTPTASTTRRGTRWPSRCRWRSSSTARPTTGRWRSTPGPAGATESLLPLDAWQAVLDRNPAFAATAPDVEAVMVRRDGGRHASASSSRSTPATSWSAGCGCTGAASTAAPRPTPRSTRFFDASASGERGGARA